MVSLAFVSYMIRGIITLIVLKPIVEWCIKRRKYVNLVNKIPGLKGYPLIGSTWLALNLQRQDIINIALARPKLYPGGISRGWLGPFPEVRVDTAELAQQVLLSKKCFGKAKIYKLMIGPWIGDGLILTTGEKWFKHRRLITSTFYFEILNRYCQVFRDKAKVLCDVLEETGSENNVFDISGYFYRFTFDVILETAFGIQLNIQKDTNNEYLRASEEIGEIAAKRAKNILIHNEFMFKLSPLGRRAKKVLKVLHDFSNKVIVNRRLELLEQDSNNSYTEDQNVQPCFLDLLLKQSRTKPFLTDEAIREEVDTFMFAGHDTTATALSWMILLIANHPNVQNSIYEEQISLFGDAKTTPDQNDLHTMEYLERVMKECLRLQPSVPCISREVTEDIELNGYTVPTGCMLTVNIYQIHRDPRYFKNPEKFNPDRFLPENYTGVDPFAYTPFSAGPRSCIGQRFAQLLMKTALATLCRNFKIHAVDNLDQVGTCREFVARPYPGIKIRIEKR